MPERPHLGSRFYPAVQAGAGNPIHRSSEGKRVLVVDDDPISRNIVRDLLATRGFEVDGSENAQGALEMVRRRSYDLLILDIFLPGLDGRVLHGSVEKINSSLAGRTIFISHWTPSGALGEYIEKHGQFLKKPFSAEDLMRAIQATVGAGTGLASL